MCLFKVRRRMVNIHLMYCLETKYLQIQRDYILRKCDSICTVEGFAISIAHIFTFPHNHVINHHVIRRSARPARAFRTCIWHARHGRRMSGSGDIEMSVYGHMLHRLTHSCTNLLAHSLTQAHVPVTLRATNAIAF